MDSDSGDLEGAGFFLNDLRKIDDPFADFKYFRARRPLFYYPPPNPSPDARICACRMPTLTRASL